MEERGRGGTERIRGREVFGQNVFYERRIS